MISKLHLTKKIAIIIFVIFIISAFVGNIKEHFRGTPYYVYLGMFSLIGVLGSVLWSFVNSVLMYKEINIKSKPNIYWLIFSAIPFLYFFIGLMIVLFYTII